MQLFICKLVADREYRNQMKILEAGTYKSMFEKCDSMESGLSSRLAKVNKLLEDLANEQEQTGLDASNDRNSVLADLQADLESTLGVSPDDFMTSDDSSIDLAKTTELAKLTQIALELRNLKGKASKISVKWR